MTPDTKTETRDVAGVNFEWRCRGGGIWKKSSLIFLRWHVLIEFAERICLQTTSNRLPNDWKLTSDWILIDFHNCPINGLQMMILDSIWRHHWVKILHGCLFVHCAPVANSLETLLSMEHCFQLLEILLRVQLEVSVMRENLTWVIWCLSLQTSSLPALNFEAGREWHPQDQMHSFCRVFFCGSTRTSSTLTFLDFKVAKCMRFNMGREEKEKWWCQVGTKALNDAVGKQGEWLRAMGEKLMARKNHRQPGNKILAITLIEGLSTLMSNGLMSMVACWAVLMMNDGAVTESQHDGLFLKNWSRNISRIQKNFDFWLSWQHPLFHHATCVTSNSNVSSIVGFIWRFEDDPHSLQKSVEGCKLKAGAFGPITLGQIQGSLPTHFLKVSNCQMLLVFAFAFAFAFVFVFVFAFVFAFVFVSVCVFAQNAYDQLSVWIFCSLSLQENKAACCPQLRPVGTTDRSLAHPQGMRGQARPLGKLNIRQNSRDRSLVLVWDQRIENYTRTSIWFIMLFML